MGLARRWLLPGCTANIIARKNVDSLHSLLERAHFSEHSVKFARIIEGNHSSHGSIIAPANKLARYPNGWYAGSTHKVGHLGTNGLAIGIRIEFNDSVFGTQIVQDLFGLDAKGASGEAEHQDRIVGNESSDTGLDGGCIVFPRQGLDESLLSIVEEIHESNFGR